MRGHSCASVQGPSLLRVTRVGQLAGCGEQVGRRVLGTVVVYPTNVSSRIANAKSPSKSCIIKSRESSESLLERLESAQAFFDDAATVTVATAGNRASADSALLQSMLRMQSVVDCCCTFTSTLAFFALLMMFNGFVGGNTTSVSDEYRGETGTVGFALDSSTMLSGLVGGSAYTMGFTGISTGGRGHFMYIECKESLDSNSTRFAIQLLDTLVGTSQRVSDMSSENTSDRTEGLSGLLELASVVSV